MSNTEATFIDENGQVRLAGQIGAPNAIAAQVLTADGAGNTSFQAGGATPPITRSSVIGDYLTIADGANGVMPWTTRVQGDVLLDLSTPTAPAVITAGVYAFFVWVHAIADMTAAGSVKLKLAVDLNNDDYETDPMPSPPATTAITRPVALVPLTWYSPAGGVLEARAYNSDGVQSLDFKLSALIQRIS